MYKAANPEVVSGGELAAAETPEITEATTNPPAGENAGGDPSSDPSSASSSQDGKTGTEEPKAGDGTQPPAAEAADSEDLTDDDPFAEFEGRVSVSKDKTYYEELFKTDKWRTVPHAARNEIIALTDQLAQKDAALSDVGGDAMLATIKPVTAVLSNPNPTNEEVEHAFDAIDAHNPKVMESLGAKFTENWVQEVLGNPMQNLNPLMQVLFRQHFHTNDYDLGRIMELVQLDLATDANGEKLLDTEYARDAFQRMGGIPTFRYQRELAARDAELQKLRQGGYGQTAQSPNTNDINAAKQPDLTQVEADIEAEVMKEVTPVLAKIGKPGDPLYELATDAAKYRIRSGQEMQNIRKFVQSGAYKTPDGKFTQGVDSNASFLRNRVFAGVLKDLKGIQSSRRGASKQTTTAQTTTTAAKTNNGSQPATTQTAGQNTNGNTASQNAQQTAQTGEKPKAKSLEDFAASSAARVKQQVADEKATRQVASGK